MNYKGVEKRIAAAQSILTSTTLDISTFESLRSLLSGINPKLDKTLKNVSTAYSHAQKIAEGDIIDLTLASLPAETEKDKKRKKAALFFLKFWNDLRSEVKRVEAQIHGHSPIATIVAGAKGPLGIITLIAVGLVVLQMTAVDIAIQNEGCDTISPVASFPVKLPGLFLPDKPIPNGGTGIAKLPPLTVTVDGDSPGSILLSGYSFTYRFTLGSSGITLLFNGQTLNNTKTTINLGEKKQHELIIRCK